MASYYGSCAQAWNVELTNVQTSKFSRFLRHNIVSMPRAHEAPVITVSEQQLMQRKQHTDD